jgi:uncharacterized membrane protein
MLIANFLLLVLLPAVSYSDFGELLQSGLGFSVAPVVWLLAFCSIFPIPIYSCHLPLPAPTEFPLELKTAQILELFPQLTRRLTIAISLGGGLLPNLWALSQLTKCSPVVMLLATAIVALIGYKRSFFSDHGVLTIAVWSAAFVSSLIAIFLDFQHCIASATASSILGITLGCDVSRLREITKMSEAPAFLVIGGAGLVDAILLSGILAAAFTTCLRYAPALLDSYRS